MKKRYFNIQHNSHKKQFCTKALLAGIFSVLVFFSSCSNAFLDGGSASGVKTGTVTGSLDFGGALPKEILDQLNSSSKNNSPQGERTAFPSIPTASSVEVYAQIENDTTKISATNVSTTSYKLGGLEFGKEYTITAKFKNDSEKIIMQGSVKVTLSDDEPVVNKNISVAPTQTNGGEGSISLSFSVDSSLNWTSSNVACSYVLDDDLEQPMNDLENEKFTFRMTSISSGAHSVKFILKNINTNYILYQFTETINVFDNLMTNNWVKNGDEPYLTSSYCKITKACVDKFAQTTFYVDSNRQTTNPSGAGYTTQSGTYFNPFVKVYSAFNKIMECSSADYTIYVKDGHSEDFEGIEFDKNISIETYKDTPGDGLGNATLKMQDGASTFLWIDSNTKFSLKNFILDGNYVENGGDGGIITNKGNTTLINCELKNGNTCGSGGAIWNTTEASITLEKCNIHDCSSDSSDDGGGIYNTGIITIKETVISGCTAGDPINSSYCDGGGIYNNGTLTLTDCTISGNTAKNGGGIYNAGNLTFKGKCVIGDESKPTTPTTNNCSNKATSNGGGLYLASPFTVDSGSKLYVCHNFATSYGGGIYIDSLSSKTLNDVVVKYCCSTAGGGVYINSSNALNCKNFDIENCTAGSTCGGIYVTGGNNNKISDSKILNCQGMSNGAGLYLGSDDPVLENVCVENCTGYGANGVYCSDRINISGTTYIDEISYVAGGATINVAATLTPKDQNGTTKDKVATIRPGTYDVGNQVLTGSAVQTEYAKFAVKPENDDSIPFHIGSDGKLFSAFGIKPKGAALAVGDIVFNDGSSTPYSVIASRNPVQCKDYEKNAAVAVIYKVESDAKKAYGVGIKLATNIAWCIEASKGDDINFTNTVSTDDGILNLKRMISQGANDTGVTCLPDGTIDFDNSDQAILQQNYPAFEFAYYYGKNEGHNIVSGSIYETGWYLPSMSELKDICNAYTSTDNALYVTSDDRLYSRYFLSSNQGTATNWTKSLCLATRQEGGYYTYNTGSNACAVRAFTW